MTKHPDSGDKLASRREREVLAEGLVRAGHETP